MEDNTVCRPGGFTLTDRMLRWWEEDKTASPKQMSGDERTNPEAPRDGMPVSAEFHAVRLADIGCGEGATLRHIREKYPDWRLIGLDPEVQSQAEAAENRKYVEWAEGQIPADTQAVQLLNGMAEELPLADHSADILLMECSFSRFADPDRALREAIRVLKPRGRLLISDMYRRGREKQAAADGGRNTAGINCRIGRLETGDVIRRRLEEQGFHLLRMMDVSRVLGDWIGQKIFDDDLDSVREALGTEPCELRRLRCGYYICEAMPSPVPELIRYAGEHSSFYKEYRTPAMACSESRILAGLPLCGPEDLRKDPTAFLCVPPKEVARIITLRSSGSEGEPKRIFFTEDDLERTADFFDWGIRSMVRPGDRTAVFMAGPTHYSVGGLLKEGLSRLPAEVTVCGFVADYDSAARQAEGMDTLIGVPAQMYRLMKEHPELRPRTVLLSADNVPDAVKLRIEQTWGCQVFTHWGMSETGYGGGVQCRCREGYHLREEDLRIEILDPETGEPLPEGESGELVLTAWNRRAMPLIRYRTGDVARMIPGRCPCGSLLPRLDRIQYRLRGQICLPDGVRMTLPEIDEIVYLQPIRACKAHWEEKEAALYLHLLPEKGLTEDDIRVMEDEIRRQIQARFGMSFAVTVDDAYDGEDAGKRRLREETPRTT